MSICRKCEQASHSPLPINKKKHSPAIFGHYIQSVIWIIPPLCLLKEPLKIQEDGQTQR